MKKRIDWKRVGDKIICFFIPPINQILGLVMVLAFWGMLSEAIKEFRYHRPEDKK